MLDRKWVGKCYLLAPFIVYSGIASAQTEDEGQKLDTMVVTSSKQSKNAASSKNISSISVSSTELENAGVNDTKDLSRVLPGLNINNSGNLLFPAISLRGISSAQDFYNPAVSFYVDDVPQLSTNTVQALTDVESVEMLKGPQATLYGSSAEGGIINIKSRKPDENYRGVINGGFASRHGYNGHLYLSGPVIEDNLFASMTLLRQSEPGAFYNPSTGSKRLGGSNENVGNIKVRLAPSTKPWELNFSATEDATDSTQDTYLDFNNPHSRKLLTSPGSIDPYLNRRTHSQTLSGVYDFGSWKVTASSAWQQLHYERGMPYGTLMSESAERWKQNTQEIRASTQGEDRLWDGVFGLYRLEKMVDRDSGVNSHVNSQSLASYMDGTWHVNPKIDLGAGVRFSNDRSDTNYGRQNAANKDGHDNSNQVLGQLSAGYLLTPDWRVYTRVAQGYKPSGFNVTPQAKDSAEPYSSEKSMNYEIGTRYNTDDVQLQSALYYTHTRDMQLYTGPIGSQTLSNAGSANALGLEANAAWIFTPGWRASWSGNVADAKFASNVTTADYANHSIPFIPKFATAASLDGMIITPAGPIMPSIAINLIGPLYFDGSNQLRQSSYSTTDLRLGWQATERVTLSGYINNIFDKRYRTYAYAQGNSAFAQFNEGLTAGMDLKIELF